MSGHECSDFGAVAYGNNLCRLPAGMPYEGLITYRDGRVTDDASNGDMRGSEIGDCVVQGGPVSFSTLQSTYNGTSLEWSPAHLSALNRALGQRAGQSGNAFFCVNPENARDLAVNSAATYRPALSAAIGSLTQTRSGFPEFDDAHYRAVTQSLRAMTGVPEPESVWDKIKGAGVYLLGGVAVFILGGLGSHIAGKWWDGGGPRGGSGGGGNSNVMRNSNGTREVTLTEGPAIEVARTSHTAFWAGVAGACFVGAGALLADDATVVGIADDPIAGAAAVVGILALGIHHVVE